MNGRVFINNSAIGLYPLMVVDRDAQQKRLGRSKRLAMVVASLRTLMRFNHQRLTLTVNDEEKARIDTPLLFVGNNDYRVDLGAPGQRDSLEDGELCVLVMRKKTRAGFVAASASAPCSAAPSPTTWCGSTASSGCGLASRRSQLTVVARRRGGAARRRPLEYRIRKRALRVIAPPAA